MENGNKSAFPVNVSEPVKNGYGDVTGYRNKVVSDGLTKREYFAALAMQGRMSAKWADNDPELIASLSIKIADELLDQLENGIKREIID